MAEFLSYLCNFTLEDWQNLVLTLGAPMAFGLAFWRSFIANKQTYIASANTEIAARSADMDRFQKGSQMYGDARVSVRQAGIIILKELSQSKPKRFSGMCQQVLERFVHEKGDDIKNTPQKMLPPKKLPDDDYNPPYITSDAQYALGVISIIQRDKTSGYCIELSGAYLAGARLSKAMIYGANLERANLMHAFLSGVNLFTANLSGAIVDWEQLNAAASIDGTKGLPPRDDKDET